MKIKSILLTGDDGYNSIGTRLLVHFLKDKYELKIAATKTQQSGVGGMINVFGNREWANTKVDGVEAIWVDGSPVDAVECALSYYQQNFDLVISGINMGVNISGSTISSGTVASAWRSFFLKMSKKAIAISWHTPSFELIFRKHKQEDEIKDYLEHPGKTAADIIKLSIKNNFWDADFLNINLPKEKSSLIKFTKFLPEIKDFYNYPAIIEGGRFSYRKGEAFGANNDIVYDGVAVRNGYISITPCKTSLLDEKVFNKVKNKTISF